ncbi:hypothetical protein [Parafrankia discariae]|uniref:hypothetical protein n=1 Tax=Parafrankia discariae TaxID=365528 RepID=UPI000476A593|nr:hypothetical protein [Parafrankia discariae]
MGPETRAQLRIGSAWVDVTDDVFVRNPVVIRHGQADEAPRADPSACSFSLNNRGGQYSPRNPYSPYYGVLGRNTPVRVQVRQGPTHLALDTGRITTPGVSALNIAGDLDVRVDCAADGVGRDGWLTLAARWNNAGNERCWLFDLAADGRLVFEWTTDGTSATYRSATSTVPVFDLFRDRRVIVRVTIDVDHGGGGRTINFFRGQSLNGPWDLISSVVQAGVTSIYAAGTAPVDLGTPSAFAQGGTCRVYGAQIRNGIGGTLVAAPDLTVQTPGATSFTDSAGRVWTVQGDAEVTDYRTRFAGEVAAWPTEWDLSGRDVQVSLQAAGVTRRLGQGASPLQSTLRRRLMSGTPALPVAYWPCEDGASATYAASPLPRVAPLVPSGWTFASGEASAGSEPLPAIGYPAAATGLVPSYRQTGEWRVEVVYRVDELPVGTYTTLMDVRATGTVVHHRILTYGPGLFVRFEGYNAAGGLVYGVGYDGSANVAGLVGSWARIALLGRQNGGNVEISPLFLSIGGAFSSFPITPYAGTLGVVTAWQCTPGEGYQGLQLGHISVWNDADVDLYASADHGYTGETAAARIIRVGAEEAVPVVVGGAQDTADAMGPQPIATFLDVLAETGEVDGGLLHDRRHTLGLRLRGRRTVYNQPVALELDYAAGDIAPYLRPVDDDQGLVNDVTVTRKSGASARVALEVGRLSVQPPPAGAGRYDTGITLNLRADEQTEPHAAWRMALGTVDEARYPTIRVDLLASPHLVDDVVDLDLLDRVQLINPPPWIPPDDVELIARGYTETINVDQWDVEINCTPGSPWLPGVWGNPDSTRADTSGSALAAAATQNATELVVATQLDPTYDRRPWAPSAGPDAVAGQHPFDARVGAEVVRVSAVDNWARDAFGRTVANSWGTPDVGGAWQDTGGAASDRSVAAGVGTILLTSTAVRHQTLVGDLGDVEILTRIVIPQTSTGAAVLAGILARYVSTTAFYRVRVHAETTGALTLSVTRAGTQLATADPGISYTPGAAVWLRMRVVGHTVLGRLWPDADAEPGFWQISTTVTTDMIDTGRVGLVASYFAGNTNVNPTLSFDDFRTITVQRLTVTRAINTVSRAWPTGTDVRLARPMRIAL